MIGRMKPLLAVTLLLALMLTCPTPITASPPADEPVPFADLIFEHPELLEGFHYAGTYLEWPEPVVVSTPLGDISISLWANVPGMGPVGLAATYAVYQSPPELGDYTILAPTMFTAMYCAATGQVPAGMQPDAWAMHGLPNIIAALTDHYQELGIPQETVQRLIENEANMAMDDFMTWVWNDLAQTVNMLEFFGRLNIMSAQDSGWLTWQSMVLVYEGQDWPIPTPGPANPGAPANPDATPSPPPPPPGTATRPPPTTPGVPATVPPPPAVPVTPIPTPGLLPTLPPVSTVPPIPTGGPPPDDGPPGGPGQPPADGNPMGAIVCPVPPLANPVVVGQDERKRGADISFRLVIPPVEYEYQYEYVHHWDEYQCNCKTDDMGNRRCSTCRQPVCAWASAVQKAPDMAASAVASGSLSPESVDWIKGELAVRYPGADVYRQNWGDLRYLAQTMRYEYPDFRYERLKNGNTDVCSCKGNPYCEVSHRSLWTPFMDPGWYELRFRVETLGTQFSPACARHHTPPGQSPCDGLRLVSPIDHTDPQRVTVEGSCKVWLLDTTLIR